MSCNNSSTVAGFGDSSGNINGHIFMTKSPLNGKKVDKMDRYIPARSSVETSSQNLECGKENTNKDDGVGTPPSKTGFQTMLASGLNVSQTSRILTFSRKPPSPPPAVDNGIRSLYQGIQIPAIAKTYIRQVPKTQERILDAPDLMDDYYLNLLDWSCTNIVAIALGSVVYLWNATSGSVEELCECADEDEYVGSLAWAVDGNFIALGTSSGKVQIWDVARRKQVRELLGHTNRVSSLSWNGSILSSGGKDSVINNWDIRKRRDEACVARLTEHEQEVCGLKWSLTGQQLASGGNDNTLCIWDAQFNLVHKIAAHAAAVKAIAWCPFQANLLATGGGTADRCMKFWNTHTGVNLSTVDTASQVCALQWSRHEKEILSSHGYTKNQLCLWKYPSLAKIAEMTGHEARVLHLAQSPDGTMVVSASADETLRFWRCFGDPPKQIKGDNTAKASYMMQSLNIR